MDWSSLQRIPISKEKVIVILVITNSLAFGHILRSREALARAKLMYENPATAQQVKIVRVQGPVRIVERIVDMAGGERVTERTEVRDAVIVSNESESSKTPTQPTDFGREYILAGSWRASTTRNGTLWAGTSVLRGLDLLGGVGADNGKMQGHLMVQGRFGG